MVEGLCINGNTYLDESECDRTIYDTLLKAKKDFIILFGYMKKISKRILAGNSNRILNIHPSLLPKQG